MREIVDFVNLCFLIDAASVASHDSASSSGGGAMSSADGGKSDPHRRNMVEQLDYKQVRQKKQRNNSPNNYFP